MLPLINRLGILLGIGYIIAIAAANLTAGNILNVYGVSFALGTLFFGAIFTLRDMLHVSIGRKRTYIFIGLAALVSAVISLTGYIDVRIIVASIVSLIISESTDTEIFQRLKVRMIFRILGSNIVSIVIDTILFTYLAFYNVWPIDQIYAVILGDVIIKFIVSFILALIYRNKNLVK